MKAIVQREYGPADVLAPEEIDKPVPAKDEVLVAVRAAAVNPADWHFMRGEPRLMRLQSGLRRPKQTVLGRDVAGVVDAVGPGATRLRPGDEVFAEADGGAFAEFVSIPEEFVETKPTNLTFEQAAAVPLAGVTALQGLRDHAKLEQGQKLLIVGASGGVGTFAVQIAKHVGAHVTGVCSGENIELVRSLGVDAVIDYTNEDFLAAGQRYDVILHLGGTHSPSQVRRALTAKGTLLLSSGDSEDGRRGPIGRMVRAMATSPFVGQRLAPFLAKRNRDDLRYLKELIDAGELTPVIGATYPLDAVPDALRQIETAHTRGKIVITV